MKQPVDDRGIVEINGANYTLDVDFSYLNNAISGV
jgi:hypothetical protein